MKRPLRPILVAIVGGSGAGKSRLADRLEHELGRGVARLALDDFYRDLSHLTFAQRQRVNFDHPRAIDWPCLDAVLRSCLAERPVRVPQYDFAAHCRRAESRSMPPARVILVDGLWLLRRPGVRALFDLRLFVECPERLRLSRRLARDVRERGRTRASVLAQFRDHVTPMHDRFVAPQQRWADVVLRSPVAEREVKALAHALLNGGQASRLSPFSIVSLPVR
ncbi:MAG: uridine kinase [Verrucomicrobia bacterium]|nr:uridine kinase [Verrucomicrobiota bacterium]